MKLDFELHAKLGDHIIIEIGTIICNDSLWDTVSIDDVMSDKLGHNVLGNRSE